MTPPPPAAASGIADEEGRHLLNTIPCDTKGVPPTHSGLTADGVFRAPRSIARARERAASVPARKG